MHGLICFLLNLCVKLCLLSLDLLLTYGRLNYIIHLIRCLDFTKRGKRRRNALVKSSINQWLVYFRDKVLNSSLSTVCIKKTNNQHIHNKCKTQLLLLIFKSISLMKYAKLKRPFQKVQFADCKSDHY